MEPVTDPVRLVTSGAEGTRAVAQAMAPLCVAGDVILLVGDLGAGKTTFAQGFAIGLGIDDSVTSPTFTLVRQYSVPDRSDPPLSILFHADLYRLDSDPTEIADLGLGELVEDGGVALVEWGDTGEAVLGRGSLGVELVPDGASDERRLVTVRAADGAWDDRWPALLAAVAPWVVT